MFADVRDLHVAQAARRNRAAASPEVLADPKVKMLSVAIHLEAGEGSEVAVAMARLLLPKLKTLLSDEAADVTVLAR